MSSETTAMEATATAEGALKMKINDAVMLPSHDDVLYLYLYL
jgi:hypothetical protein